MRECFYQDRLQVQIYDSREEMGAAAAEEIAQAIGDVLKEQPCCNMIFAAAPSQNETLAGLVAAKNVEWVRVRAFHMDEYIGLPASAPQGFANFLRRSLFDKVEFREIYCLDSTSDASEEIRRYTGLLKKYPADIAVMGIGENGHIAFNDPHAADFCDPEWVKVVTLDETCRMQQVHDGCFDQLGEVPKQALTLTIPALCAAKRVFCVVPAKTKARAAFHMLRGSISEQCPASVLRKHENARLYLDADSASLL